MIFIEQCHFAVFTMLIFTMFAAFLVCVHGAGLKSAPMVDNRIVGGLEGNIIETPYLVSLLYDEFVTGNFRHICGGAIINNHIILTAAKCTDGRVRRPESYRVRAGSNSHKSGGVISVVSKIIPHEYYEIGGNHENDISLVFLSTALTMGIGIGIINLPSPFIEPEPGSNAVVTGWGTNNDLSKPDRFHRATVKIMSRFICQNYLPDYPVTGSMICTLGVDSQGPCDGDEGGPLAYNGQVIGIISWRNRNVGCDNPQSPSAYTKVSVFRDWIDQHI
ncbi:uncharacterized protein LOC143910221 [Arctopsyche grandis]|uniref:uncharacterized protein LOC143910221 n=1 Tax=Arctopsyche grandis TaxID=121162 RepID=UPI00406D7B0A